MLNREIYLNDPTTNKLANNGVAIVKDEQTDAELQTLAYELRTFVCDGAYEKGMGSILGAFLDNVKSKDEQKGVWISGFFGSGKSHLAKMLRTLWTNQKLPNGQYARDVAHDLPLQIRQQFEELSSLGKTHAGLHAASGTLGAGVKDKVRLALLSIIFKSAGLPAQYHLAKFVLWLKSEGIFEDVKKYVEAKAKGKPGEDLWGKELRGLHVSPLMADAILTSSPSMASDNKEVREMIRAQFVIVKDVSNDEMVQAIIDTLATDGELPLTLVVLDEVQQYIGDDAQKAFDVQEAVETCTKAGALKSRLLFVATGQSSLAGLNNLQRLMGRFQVNVQLEDTDVDSVIRKVLLQKKESVKPDVERILENNLGEISRHLRGSTIESRREDEDWMTADYPLLPVRRRFWERTLQVLDATGTGSQLRNQLRTVHEATKITAEKQLGNIVAADFIYDQNAGNLLQTGVISKDIYENISRLKGGDEKQVLQGRLLSLILLINKLPQDAELGIIADADSLSDLLIEDLEGDTHKLRAQVPEALAELEEARLVLSMQTSTGEEYRLQTAESQQWYETFKLYTNEQRSNANRLDNFRNQEIQQYIRNHISKAKVTQGKANIGRTVLTVFDNDLPADANQKIYAWAPSFTESKFLDVAKGADPEGSTIYIYVPDIQRTDLITAIVEYKAAEHTLDVRDATTDAGKEARSAMDHRLREADRKKRKILSEIFGQIQVKLAGGADVAGDTLTEQIENAGNTAANRLYKEFYKSDDEGWGAVYNRASKEGGENSLEAIGHLDEADKHPVIMIIKRYINLVKTGKEVRDHFSAAPYGWSQDTIDGALYAMIAAGILKASDSQEKPVDAKNLERKKVGMAKFRPENVTVSKVELIKVRSLINALGVSCTAGEEASKLSLAIANAKQTARRAGGDAPLPACPKSQILDALEALSGNAQLKEAYEKRNDVQSDFDAWITLAEQVEARQRQWSELTNAMKHCEDLSIYSTLNTERQAIINNRSLLANPNPVDPLLKQAIDAIRVAITARLDAYETEYHEGMRDLEAHPTWSQLDEKKQQVLLEKHNLTKLPTENLSGNDSVLDSITETTLQQWSDRTAALPSRFDHTLKEAISALTPKIKHVRVPRSTIEDEDQLQAWLKATEAELREQLSNGPVAIS